MSNECIFTRSGKLMYAVRVDTKKEGYTYSFLIVEDGSPKYIGNSGYIDDFNPTNQAHAKAKEIFIKALKHVVEDMQDELQLLRLVLESVGIAMFNEEQVYDK